MLIETSDGSNEWTTVGVSDNVIHASWEALTESYAYGLLHSRPSMSSRTRDRAGR